MLYKKVHRQFLREFRIGRKYRYCGICGRGEVRKLSVKPYIGENAIQVDGWYLIYMTGPGLGRTCIFDFEWLED